MKGKKWILIIILIGILIILLGTLSITVIIPRYKAKVQIEQDTLESNKNGYKKFDMSIYTKQPDRIVCKLGNKDKFYLFDQSDKDYPHLLETAEDRMYYAKIEDYNLTCFTPVSIDTMMLSEDNYLVFDYDKESQEADPFPQVIIFRFIPNNRLYRLVSYLCEYRKSYDRNQLGKEEFIDNIGNTITGYQYMTSYYNN